MERFFRAWNKNPAPEGKRGKRKASFGWKKRGKALFHRRSERVFLSNVFHCFSSNKIIVFMFLFLLGV
jgi:hypothetical protein